MIRPDAGTAVDKARNTFGKRAVNNTTPVAMLDFGGTFLDEYEGPFFRCKGPPAFGLRHRLCL